MKNLWVKKIWTGLILLALTTAAYAALGISTNFTNVFFADLKRGKTHDLAALAGRPFLVKNPGSTVMRVRVEPESAMEGALLPGHAPMPSSCKLEIIPQEFDVPAGGSATAQVLLTLPNDKALAGKKFQGALWIRTVGAGDLQVAVRTKVPFTVKK